MPCRSPAGGRCSTARAATSTPAWRASSRPSSTSSRAGLAARSAAGVIHADLFHDNVFFLDDKLSGLIDFYFACNDAFAYDVAICLNAWCFEADKSFNATKARALLQGYDRRAAARRRRARRAAAAGARRRPALPADPALRLGAHAGRRAGEAQGSAANISPSCASIAASRRSRITGCEPGEPAGRSRDLHRRRLQRKSRTGRLGRDPAHGRPRARAVRRRARRPPTTGWS